MDQAEFHEQFPALVNDFMPRIPTEFKRGFTYTLGGGEYRLAMEDLVGLLVQYQIPVTASEQEQLRQMLAYLKWKDENVADTFIVQSEAETSADEPEDLEAKPDNDVGQ